MKNDEVAKSFALASNPEHQYLLGELATALDIATSALADIAGQSSLLGRRSAQRARDALSTIQAMSGEAGRLGPERIKNLKANYRALSHQAAMHSPE